MSKDNIPDDLTVEKVDKRGFKNFIVDELEKRNLDSYLYSDLTEVCVEVGETIGTRSYPGVKIKVNKDKSNYSEIKDMFKGIGYEYKDKEYDNTQKILVFEPK